jgi:hypothetical protein
MTSKLSPGLQTHKIWDDLAEEMNSYQMVTSKCGNDSCNKTQKRVNCVTVVDADT